MHFRYRLFTGKISSVPLGGRWSRPRPVIAVSLIGAYDVFPTDALLDTGADETIFPETAARKLGIDLTNAPTGSSTGLGSAQLPVRYAKVPIRISDGNEHREWLAWIGFTPIPMTRPLLGFAGFLQFFTATFHGDREEVFLEVNALYRGT